MLTWTLKKTFRSAILEMAGLAASGNNLSSPLTPDDLVNNPGSSHYWLKVTDEDDPENTTEFLRPDFGSTIGSQTAWHDAVIKQVKKNGHLFGHLEEEQLSGFTPVQLKQGLDRGFKSLKGTYEKQVMPPEALRARREIDRRKGRRQGVSTRSPLLVNEMWLTGLFPMTEIRQTWQDSVRASTRLSTSRIRFHLRYGQHIRPTQCR